MKKVNVLNITIKIYFLEKSVYLKKGIQASTVDFFAMSLDFLVLSFQHFEDRFPFVGIA